MAQGPLHNQLSQSIVIRTSGLKLVHVDDDILRHVRISEIVSLSVSFKHVLVKHRYRVAVIAFITAKCVFCQKPSHVQAARLDTATVSVSGSCNLWNIRKLVLLRHSFVYFEGLAVPTHASVRVS